MEDSCIWSSTSDSIDRDGVLTGRRRPRHLHPPHIGLGGRQASGAMTIARGTRVLATAALLFATLAACSDDNGDPTTSDSTSTTSPASATTPPTESQQAAAVAEAKLREYYATTNRLRQDPSLPVSALKSVAISSELTSQQHLLGTERKEGRRQIGNTEIAELTVQNVNLDNSDPRAGQVPVVQIDVCYDVSGADLVDRDGRSVVSTDRPDSGWIRHTVANYEWESDPYGAWRVASSQDIEQTPCDV